MSDKVSESTVRSIERDPRPTHSIRITADRILVAQPKEVGERKTRGGWASHVSGVRIRKLQDSRNGSAEPPNRASALR